MKEILSITIGLAIGLFLVLTVFSGVIGGILLILNGNWLLVLQLAFFCILAPLLMILVLLPSAIFLAPAASLEEKGRMLLGSIFFYLWLLYSGAVFGLWSTMIMMFVFENTTAFWGAIFSSYGAAVIPIFIMGSTYPDRDAIIFPRLMASSTFAMISSFVLIVFAIVSGGTFIDLFVVYFVCFSMLASIATIEGYLTRLFFFE